MISLPGVSVHPIGLFTAELAADIKEEKLAMAGKCVRAAWEESNPDAPNGLALSPKSNEAVRKALWPNTRKRIGLCR
jgi:hypothetical protein